MRLRSLLFVPGDSERKFAKARDIGADVLILERMYDSHPTTPTQDDLDAIREGVRAACAPFDDDYWLDRQDTGEFPRDFNRAMADA